MVLEDKTGAKVFYSSQVCHDTAESMASAGVDV